MSHEFYDILGVAREASADEIKKAYRKKAMELHPDRHGGDKAKEAEFKKLNEAYSTLSDPTKKANYDRFGTAEGMGGGFGGGFQGGFDVDLGDIFSSFFGGGFGGGGNGRKRAEVGDDIEIKLKISLEDVIRGSSRLIEFDRQHACEHCHATGGKTKTCDTCHGTGQVRERVQTVFGVMEQARVCHACNGDGKIITEKCEHCHGKKYTKERIKKDIEIPAGIENGMSIKIRGEGHEGHDGNGDLYITFDAPTREGGLTRDGANLHYEVKLSPAEAAIGTEKVIEIPILGRKTLTIKSATQHGDTITFRDEGIMRLDRKNTKGDLHIHYAIDIPHKLSSEEKKLYEALLHSQ